MSDQPIIDELRGLTVDERLRLMEEVWASLSEAPEDLDVPDWHREELKKRVAAYERDPGAARAWDDVKADILRALVK